jgi:Flp pilus assembly protein TadG
VKRRARRPRNVAHAGQTLVIFALTSTVLLAGMGLVLDAGYDFVQRRTMQNAADAAALAGAQILARDATTTEVFATVSAVAVENGVPSSANVRCQYITDANTTGVAACEDGVAPPTDYGTITGVAVTVGETHGTFVMKAIGIATSGTAATAAAQIQVLGGYPGTAAPFAPCGVKTKLASDLDGASTFSIFETEDDPIYDNKGKITGYNTVVVNDADNHATIRESAYSFDWLGLNGLSRPGPGVTAPADRPEFLIHGPQIEECGVHSSSWKGLNGEDGEIILPAPPGDDEDAVNIWAEPGTKAGPSRQVAGSLGCGVGEANGCIMILPIVDTSGPGGNGTHAYVAARQWGAFWVTQISANEHAGRLIANYPITANGNAGWTPSYGGPVVIRLIR